MKHISLLWKKLRGFKRHESGMTTVEYGILFAVFMVIVITSASSLYTDFRGTLTNTSGNFQQATSQSGFNGGGGEDGGVDEETQLGICGEGFSPDPDTGECVMEVPMGGGGGGGWGGGGGVMSSDRRLKHDIHALATMPNGLKVYSFKYLNSNQVFVGVMAQDLLADVRYKDSVIKLASGFYAVNYNKLDIHIADTKAMNSEGKKALAYAIKAQLIDKRAASL